MYDQTESYRLSFVVMAAVGFLAAPSSSPSGAPGGQGSPPSLCSLNRPRRLRFFAASHQDTCITRCASLHVTVTVLRAYTTRR